MPAFTSQQDPIGAQTLEVMAGAKKFSYWMYQQIQPFLKGHVLEIGCGIGNISTYLLQDGFSTTLSDYNPAYLSTLQHKFVKYPNLQAVLSINLQHPNFEIAYADLCASFDTIFLLNVIEHLPFDAVSVAHCQWLLKPEGRLIVLAPAYKTLFCNLDKNLGHYRRYTQSSLAQLLINEQLAVIKKRYFNLAGIIGWFIQGKLLKGSMLNNSSLKVYNALVPFFKVIDRLIRYRMGLSVWVVGKKNSK
jgi:2-polyprenyl-3-methyl-5-hydroxy-6-metoxy-1,4-benzoquinol methylase